MWATLTQQQASHQTLICYCPLHRSLNNMAICLELDKVSWVMLSCRLPKQCPTAGCCPPLMHTCWPRGSPQSWRRHYHCPGLSPAHLYQPSALRDLLDMAPAKLCPQPGICLTTSIYAKTLMPALLKHCLCSWQAPLGLRLIIPVNFGPTPRVPHATDILERYLL